MTKNQEIWKGVEGYANYEVSNFGNVRRKDTGKHLAKIRMNTAYYCVHIGGKMLLIHRLVAKAFCLNGGNYTQVNFLNEDKSDCTAWNLEWCDVKWNNNWATRNERAKSRVYKAVCKYSTDGVLLQTYNNATEAVKDVSGTTFPNLILLACKGKRETAYGYKWAYSMTKKYAKTDKVA